MTCVGEKKEKIKMNKNNLQQKQPSCLKTNYSQFTIHHSLKRKSAFTLAEVLVTLGVIGVLFALIIPFITSAYKKNLVSHRLQKFYNIFNGALELSKVENGDPLEWTYCFSDDCLSTKSQTEFFNTYIFAYMIGLEKCSIGGKCANIKVPNEISRGDANASSWFRYVFADGSCFGIKLGGIANDKTSANIHGFFDYNCGGAPNTAGKDVFEFWVIPGNSKANFHYAYHPQISVMNREQLKNLCIENNITCGVLIQYDNWKVSNDYPLKL